MKLLINQTRLMIALIMILSLISKIGLSQNYHSNIEQIRDGYYVVYFDKAWKPLSLQESKILSGGEYKWIGNEEAAFKHLIADYDTAFFYRFIYLRKFEVKSYIERRQTKISENKQFVDYYTLYVKGKGTIGKSSVLQFAAQRATFMGVNNAGGDSIHSEGSRYWLDKNGTCTGQDYYRTYKNYELVSNVYRNGDDCEKQNRGYSYSWRKDGKEILYVFNSNTQKAVFLRRPDSDSCLAAYFIVKNNYSTYQPTTHWVVGDFQYLLDRYFGGDPVQSSGNSDETGDFLKAYWRDFPGTLFFPFRFTSNWKALEPDVSKWFMLPEIDKKLLEEQWNDLSTNKAIGNIATEIGREYLNNGGYWSAKFSKSGKDCNTWQYEEIY